jgi:hypothetical protein
MFYAFFAIHEFHTKKSTRNLHKTPKQSNHTSKKLFYFFFNSKEDRVYAYGLVARLRQTGQRQRGPKDEIDF